MLKALLQRWRPSEWTGAAISAALHLAVIVGLTMWHFDVQLDDMKVAVESLFSEERPPEEFTRELSENTETSETMNIVAGGATVGAVAAGTGAPAVSQTKIEKSESFSDPQVAVNLGDISLPGLDELGTDLGEGVVRGEPQAVAEGYGAALSRISQEIIRMMREDRVVVAWLFDESESMKDDQKEIREQIYKVYDELGIAMERDEQLKKGQEILLTSINSFGSGVQAITPKPTADLKEIKAAIDKIPNDPTGRENVLTAVASVVDSHRRYVSSGGRKLAVIVVTDESGDDIEGDALEETLKRVKAAKCPVYIMGREALFGYKIGRMRWKDPKYGLDHWLEIHRGPETPFPEALQYDGLHDRWDAHPSGFAPYELARLARESGGIYFLLPHEEENLAGQPAVDARKFAFLDMKEYNPDLQARRRYLEERNRSKFRLAVSEIVRLLDPRVDKELSVQEIWYPIAPEGFKSAGQANFDRARRAMGLISQAVAILEKVRPLRDAEESTRWRANYDLAFAQLLAYRVRLFQFLLAMDQQLTTLPKPKNPMNNAWNVARVQEMLEPTERQIKLTGVDLDELKGQLERARSMFEFVKKTHPQTPWAARAQFELNQGFGMRFVETFRDPRYDTLTDIKFPTL
ncbi:MAG: vWA domain-containing protein [Planctomycetaceae bacterium]